MKVSELIEELSNFDEDLEVRLAIQPHYPFQHVIDQVICADIYDGADEEFVTCPKCDGEGVLIPDADDTTTPAGERPDCPRCDGQGEVPNPDTTEVVYIAEGGQLYSAPYLPGEASSQLGWR